MSYMLYTVYSILRPYRTPYRHRFYVGFYGTGCRTVITTSAAAAGSQREGGWDARIARAGAILELESTCLPLAASYFNG